MLHVATIWLPNLLTFLPSKHSRTHGPHLSELTLYQETEVLQVGCSQKEDLRKVQKWFNLFDKLGYSISSGRRVGVVG